MRRENPIDSEFQVKIEETRQHIREIVRSYLLAGHKGLPVGKPHYRENTPFPAGIHDGGEISRPAGSSDVG